MTETLPLLDMFLWLILTVLSGLSLRTAGYWKKEGCKSALPERARPAHDRPSEMNPQHGGLNEVDTSTCVAK